MSPPHPSGAFEPMSDEQLDAVTIGDRVPLNGPVALVEYDPNWPGVYQREAGRIRAALGKAADRVEHVGSTSVPGLAAKPIIDIVLTVSDASDEMAYVADLEAIGYLLRIREPEWYEHRCLKGPEMAINLHVFSTGCSEVERMLRFRDRLRSHDADRLLYEETKRELAGRRWTHVQNYADAKTEVVEAILSRTTPTD